MAAHRKSDRRRVDTGCNLLKYCSRSEPCLNCGSPTLRFGEVLDFSLSFCLRHPAAWPAAFQGMFKNNAESSLFELLRDVFSKNFQSSMPFVWFLMFISFHRCGYHRLYQVSVVWIVLLHLHMDRIAVRRLRPYAHRLGRAQPPRTSAPRGGAVQALQPRQLHRDHWVGAAMVANVCSIFAVCVWISIFATSSPLLVLPPLSTVTMERGSRNLVTVATACGEGASP